MVYSQIGHRDAHGLTAISHAVNRGSLEVVKYLYNCDWLVEEASKSQAIQSAFVLSSREGFTEMSQFLLDRFDELKYCHIDGTDHLTGETALTAACLQGNKPTVHMLIARGAATAQPNSDGYSPFLCAVKAGFWDISVVLLRHGADVQHTDSFGRTALMVASAEGHLELISMLLANGWYICILLYC